MHAFVPDLCGLETCVEKDWIMEISEVSCSVIRCWNGTADFHSYCLRLMVPFYLNLSNPTHVQSSVQSGSGNFSHPCRKQPKFWDIIVCVGFCTCKVLDLERMYLQILVVLYVKYQGVNFVVFGKYLDYEICDAFRCMSSFSVIHPLCIMSHI